MKNENRQHDDQVNFDDFFNFDVNENNDDEKERDIFSIFDEEDGFDEEDDSLDTAFGSKDIDEKIMTDAMRLFAESGRASVSLLQRRLKIGFDRAGKILEKLEEMGLVDASSKFLTPKAMAFFREAKIESEADTASVGGRSRRAVKANGETEDSKKAMAEFQEIAKWLNRKNFPNSSKIKSLVSEAQIPLQTARGIKQLVELYGNRDGEANKNTFSAQMDTLVQLPYCVYGETHEDFDALENGMNAAVLYSKPAVKKLIRAFKSHIVGETLQGKVVILVGPSKTGKTTLIRTLRDIAGQYVYEFDCNGLSDSFSLDASSHIYTNGRPSQLINMLIEAGINNPFLVFDNVDKMSNGGKGSGDPATVLAKWLNRTTNRNYIDGFLNVPIDLSSVNFILTAERLEAVPVVLKNQATIIEMGSYDLEEKVDICTSFIVKQALTDNNLSDTAIVFEREAIIGIINEKAFEPGLAELIKIIEDIVAREVDGAKINGAEKIVITAQYVDDYFKEGNAKAILRLTDSKYESFRRLAKRLPDYSRKEQDKILARAKENEYYLSPSEEKFFDLLSHYPRGLLGEAPTDYKAIESMAAEYYGANESKEQLLTAIAKNMLSGRQDGIVIGLIGNPGVGKTNFAQFAAKLLNRPYVAISMANVVDPSEITGVKDKKIGKISQAFINAGSERPLILIDELEKASREVQNAFLAYLDPIQNNDLVDEYLSIVIPVQQAIIIATVNDTDNLSWPVYDRLDKVWMDDYSPMDKVQIAKRGAIAKYTVNAGLCEGNVIFSDEILMYIAKRYGIGSGFRRMQKMLQRIIGACAREVLSKGLDKSTYEKRITEADVFECLGEAIVRERKIEAKNSVGVVNGLAAGNYWGSVLPIEATVYPGNGEYELTGSLGEVMRESARVARAAVRKLLADEGSTVDMSKIGINLHAPDGAQKKEGPSAGIAIAIALYSAATGQKVNGEYAMSGEINLQGDILAVGGLESKLTAAFESGIKTVLLSDENRKDVEQIDNPDIDKSRICYISTLREALDIVIVNGNQRKAAI